MAEIGKKFTYKDQPGNLVAYKLGSATHEAAESRGGDFIDLGLSLLRELERNGIGVVLLKDMPD